jgi:hypothetical protein
MSLLLQHSHMDGGRSGGKVRARQNRHGMLAMTPPHSPSPSPPCQMRKEQQDHAMQYMGALQRAQLQTKSAHVVVTGAHAIKAAEVMPKPVRPIKVSATTGCRPRGKYFPPASRVPPTQSRCSRANRGRVIALALAPPCNVAARRVPAPRSPAALHVAVPHPSLVRCAGQGGRQEEGQAPVGLYLSALKKQTLLSIGLHLALTAHKTDRSRSPFPFWCHRASRPVSDLCPCRRPPKPRVPIQRGRSRGETPV